MIAVAFIFILLCIPLGFFIAYLIFLWKCVAATMQRRRNKVGTPLNITALELRRDLDKFYKEGGR